jgi:hypothetical protein
MYKEMLEMRKHLWADVFQSQFSPKMQEARATE